MATPVLTFGRVLTFRHELTFGPDLCVVETPFLCRCTFYMLHVRTVPVLILGSMFIRLDLTSTDRVKRMKGVFISGRYLFTEFYGSPLPLLPHPHPFSVSFRVSIHVLVPVSLWCRILNIPSIRCHHTLGISAAGRQYLCACDSLERDVESDSVDIVGAQAQLLHCVKSSVGVAWSI